VLAHGCIDHKKFDRVMPAANRLWIGERRGKPLGHKPRTGGGDGAIDSGHQGSMPLARERPHQLKIAARRLIDD